MAQIATEVGWPRSKVRRWLRDYHWIGLDKHGRPPTYEARVIDLILALRDQPHRSVQDPATDWLSEFLSGGEPHA